MLINFNLKKGKSEVLLFGIDKRLNRCKGCQVKLSVNGSPINTTTCYKYLSVLLTQHLILNLLFKKFTRRQQKKSKPLMAHPFQH